MRTLRLFQAIFLSISILGTVSLPSWADGADGKDNPPAWRNAPGSDWNSPPPPFRERMMLRDREGRGPGYGPFAEVRERAWERGNRNFGPRWGLEDRWGFEGRRGWDERPYAGRGGWDGRGAGYPRGFMEPQGRGSGRGAWRPSVEGRGPWVERGFGPMPRRGFGPEYGPGIMGPRARFGETAPLGMGAHRLLAALEERHPDLVKEAREKIKKGALPHEVLSVVLAKLSKSDDPKDREFVDKAKAFMKARLEERRMKMNRLEPGQPAGNPELRERIRDLREKYRATDKPEERQKIEAEVKEILGKQTQSEIDQLSGQVEKMQNRLKELKENQDKIITEKEKQILSNK